MTEPCMCGAEDCKRCRPGTWMDCLDDDERDAMERLEDERLEWIEILREMRDD